MDDGLGSFDHQSIDQFLKNREFGKACLELAYECLSQAYMRLQLANRAYRKASDDRFIVKLGHYAEIAMRDIGCAEQLIAELERQSVGNWERKREDLALLSQYAKDLKKAATSVALGSWSEVKLPSRVRMAGEFL
jgi:phosphosulfolactate phosphohydrolase-like enzyme